MQIFFGINSFIATDRIIPNILSVAILENKEFCTN